MSGMRKENMQAGTNNCYGDAARQVGMEALEGNVLFIRVLKKDAPKDEVCVSTEGLVTPYIIRLWEMGVQKPMHI